MVRQVKILLAIVALCCALGTTAHAASYTAYDGNMSTTYITYFKDILSGVSFNDNYVAFRSGQYDYVMAVGEIEYDGQVFTGGDCTIYTISTNSGYNATYSYSVTEGETITLNPNDEIIYSDKGNYPQLIERGAKYEIFTAVLVCVALLSVVVGRFFRKR